MREVFKFTVMTNPSAIGDISNCLMNKAGKHPLLATAAVGGALLACYYLESRQEESEQNVQHPEENFEQQQGEGWSSRISNAANNVASYIGV